MGRFYNGDIEGKFWFGVQESNDADHFGVEGQILKNWLVCGCEVGSSCENYCDGCYDTYQEHLDDAIDEEIQIEDGKLFEESNQLSYEFNLDHLSDVKKVVKQLESEYGHFITSFEIEDDFTKGDSITYEVDIVEEIEKNKNEEMVFIARLCLGKQILYCLEKYKKCTFLADL